MSVIRQRPARRRGQRGSATVVVAVGGVALMAATGLAIDGGMAAGAYRHAQNAADAGALAAARREFTDIMSTPPVVSTDSELSPISQAEVKHNGAQQTAFSSLGQSGSTSPVVVATSSGGVSSQAALANIVTTVSPGVGLPSVDATLTVNNSQDSIGVAPTAGSSWHGSWASAMTYLGYASSQALAESGYITCSSESATYGSPGSAQSCPPGTLPPQVSDTGTLATTQNPDAEVSSNNVPSSAPSMTVLNETATAGAVTVSSNLVQSSNNLYWDPTTGMTSLAAMSATNVHLATSQLNVDATTLNFSLAVDYNASTGQPQITPYCATQSIILTPQGGTATTVPIDPDCQPAGPLPNMGPLVTVTMPSWSPSNLDLASACTYASSTGGWSCPQIKGCLIEVSIPSTSTDVCLGQAVLTFSVAPLTSSNTLPTFLGEVKTTATLAQPTYFMRVLGWSQTKPTASATASIESVVDESDSAFAASPFAMPADAWEMDSSLTSPATFGPLVVGRDYYLYGSEMQTYSPSAYMPSDWVGPFPTDSSHKVGQHISNKDGSSATKPATYGGSTYYLEPVFGPASGQILYYAVFLPVPGHDNWGELVNSVPSAGGLLVQATSVPGWTVLNQGAASIKLVQ